MSRHTIPVDDPASKTDAPSAGFALWNLGFRPFYLLASVFAALSVALWALTQAGVVAGVYRGDPTWHGHEMLFGFTTAVVAGFLFTAVRNWAAQPTPSGALLAAFALLWLAGRVLVLTPFAIASAVVNAAFPAAVAAGIAVPLLRSRNRRNYFFIALLIALSCAVLALHLAYAGFIERPARASLHAALDVVLFIMAVMAGRVVPMFTNNGIPGTQAKRHPLVEKLALGSLILLLAADVVGLPDAAILLIAIVAALAHAVRLYLWQPWRTVRTPIVWILHAAYAWIVVHLALRACAVIGLVPPSLATHALTIGAIGGLTIGMMTRTARGHTGRPLVADRFEIACYVLVMIAALLRLGGAFAPPSLYIGTVVASAICWSLAYGLYAIRYWPILSRPRADGKPG
jgi:uncharacterized protein involved in response to NO